MTKLNIWTSYYGNTFRSLAEKIMLGGQDKVVVIVLKLILATQLYI